MDTITHAMFGALASRAVTGKPSAEPGNTGKYVPVMVTAVAAAFPDSDYLLFPINPLAFLAEWHRSYTNSVVLLPIWTLLLTGIIVLLFPRMRKHPIMIGGFVALGIASHILLDLLTVYGARIFFPLSMESFSFGTTFVIDPYLSFIVFTGLVLSFFRAPRFVAITSIAVLCAYVLFQWHLKTEARYWGETENGETIALPQPYSPFHFRIIQRENHHYKTALLDILGVSEKLQSREGTIPFIEQASAFRSRDNIQWEKYSLFGENPHREHIARTAWNHEAMALYRDFARFPVLYRIDENNGETCVWFSDLRYHISIMTPSFRYGMCRNNNNEWKRYRLKYFSEERD